MRYRRERRYCYYTKSNTFSALYWSFPPSSDKDDSITLFQGLSLRLPVARTEKELKHGFQVVSRRKAVYNETPVEFIPEEGKTRR
ncbi:Aspartate/glutamate leucyltransferase [Trichinella spiralis]|uniref:Aspartate/glutamate leucyltransferase n=1 Tax=Trichinella spiralis TaxID=6334 RepID=A0ABR3KIV9_TRISP